MGCCENPASKKPKGENKVNSLFSVLSPDRKALDLVPYRCQKKPPRLPGGVTKGHTKSKIHDSRHSRFIPLKASKPALLETQGISFCRGDQSCNRAWQNTHKPQNTGVRTVGKRTWMEKKREDQVLSRTLVGDFQVCTCFISTCYTALLPECPWKQKEMMSQLTWFHEPRPGFR